MKQRAWLLYLWRRVLVTAAYLFVPGSSPGPLFNLIAISSPIVIVIAVRMWKPQTRLPWYLFALGQAFFVAGDVITYNYDQFFGTALPFPSVGDVFYLSVYPCLIAGILLLVRRRRPGRDRESVIDSLIVAVGIGVDLVGLPVVADRARPARRRSPEARQHGLPGHGPRAADRRRPARDRRRAGERRAFYLMPGRRSRCSSRTSSTATSRSRASSYDQSGYLEAGWATFYILWGAAALHGSMSALSERTPDKRPGSRACRLWLLALASLLAPSVLMVQHLRERAERPAGLIGAVGRAVPPGRDPDGRPGPQAGAVVRSGRRRCAAPARRS